MQRRIDKRTADLYRERAEKEQLAARLSALEARVSGEPEQQAGNIDPMALAREIAAVDRITEKSNAIAKDGEKRFAGEFREALATVQEEAGALFHSNGKATAIGEVILDSDDPAALLHHLGKNPDLAADLQGLSAAQLGRRIGRIEAQMASKPPQTKPVSKAPDPVKPLGSNRSVGNIADMDMDAYVQARKAQGARWAR
jgi:BMFP domain-containing protein YqiC